MKLQIILLTLLALSNLNQAFAHGHNHHRCVQEHFTRLSESVKLGDCTIEKDLSLVWTVKNYPLFRDNPRRVQYWEGSFSRPMYREMTLLRELVDECNGKILSQNQIVQPSTETIRFEVLNPNLDSSIKESYMLVPMTDQEANQEKEQAKTRCEQYSRGLLTQ